MPPKKATIMSNTLRDLIVSNDFTGYRITEADWTFESDDIENAIYGFNGASNLSDDVIQRFAADYQLELIAINTWICTDTHVGLQILRIQDRPVATVWQSARKSERTISFLNKNAFKIFKEAWESSKEPPKDEANILPVNALDMPVPGPKEKSLDMDTFQNDVPGLTAYGVADWIERQGGLELITHRPSLGYTQLILANEIKQSADLLTRLRGLDAKDGALPASALDTEFKKLEDDHAALLGIQANVNRRIQELA